MSSISTHVLDLVRGGPAVGVEVHLEQLDGGAWRSVVRGSTNADGRVADLIPRGSEAHGTYCLTFDTGGYFRRVGGTCFYPYVPIVFHIPGPGQHYHVPLLLGPYGYSTYRGS